MSISKIKAIWSLLTGGIAGISKYFLAVFNDQILSKITDKVTGLKYLHDVQAAYSFLRAIMVNHSEDLSEKRKQCLETILSAIEELTKALEDFKIEEEELDTIIAKIQEAIDAFKRN